MNNQCLIHIYTYIESKLGQYKLSVYFPGFVVSFAKGETSLANSISLCLSQVRTAYQMTSLIHPGTGWVGTNNRNKLDYKRNNFDFPPQPSQGSIKA